MKHTASYDARLHNGQLVVIDRNRGGMSVTNAMESVIGELGARFPTYPFQKKGLIYQDSDGVWDGVRFTPKGAWVFVPLRTRLFEEAITAYGYMMYAVEKGATHYRNNPLMFYRKLPVDEYVEGSPVVWHYLSYGGFWMGSEVESARHRSSRTLLPIPGVDHE